MRRNLHCLMYVHLIVTYLLYIQKKKLLDAVTDCRKVGIVNGPNALYKALYAITWLTDKYKVIYFVENVKLMAFSCDKCLTKIRLIFDNMNTIQMT